MFLPSLVLVSEFARRGVGEGLFGAFQMAGSVGFMVGPLVGGLLVEWLRAAAGLVVLGLVSWRVRGALASE